MDYLFILFLCVAYVLCCTPHPSVAQDTSPKAYAQAIPQSQTNINNKPLPPAILLAHVYHANIQVSDYLISEKLDGIRAIWDGRQLLTRQGHVIHAPAWFTQGFPKQALDGELWLGRGTFEHISSIVRKTNPDPHAWQSVKYYVFELPNANGNFAQRADHIQQLVRQAKLAHLKAVPQFRVTDHVALKRLLQQIVAQKGEGVMLHRADAMYVTGRSQVLLKLKPQLDAEAKVIAIVPGKGKYLGKMGALLVETADGVRFKLGTGFTDAQRAAPPKLGSLVTYTYRDLTLKGKPKFAHFLRERLPETSAVATP